MTRAHRIDIGAAIGGLTAIALLVGFPAVNADELADLRANQELLQQRIEQLAQTPPGLLAPAKGGPTTVQMMGGSFPRSFLIPGTETSIRVGGFADLTMDYWFQNGQVNGTQTTTVGNNGRNNNQPLDIHGQQIPVPGPGSFTPGVQFDHSRGNGIFSMSAKETRLNVESRTPTSWGEARTFIEFDFGGSTTSVNNATHVSNSILPRLRYAYGTLGGFLAGQANSNFTDNDASPETLDFGGNVGGPGVVRIAQVRYTYAGPWGSAWSGSLETPETDILTPGGQVQTDTNSLVDNPVSLSSSGTCIANGHTFATNNTGCTLATNPTKSPAPDITFASYWAQPWGHMDFRVVGRDLQVMDGAFLNRHFFGYGGGISGDVKPGWFGWKKDDIVFTGIAGTGIGRYQNDSSNAALATNFLLRTQCATPTPSCQGLAAASNILVKPDNGFSAQAGYQHWWLPNLRSNVSYGLELHNYSSQLLGPRASVATNKQLQTVHVNLIWSPVAFIDTGIEYVWGQRKVVANIYGTEQLLVGKFRVKF